MNLGESALELNEDDLNPSARLILFKINSLQISIQLKSIIKMDMWKEFLEFLVSHPIWDIQTTVLKFGKQHPNKFEIKQILTHKNEICNLPTREHRSPG
jgi:hypothetical protein